MFQELLNQHFINSTVNLIDEMIEMDQSLRFDELVVSYYLNMDSYYEIDDFQFLFKLADFFAEAGWFRQAFKINQFIYEV